MWKKNWKKIHGRIFELGYQRMHVISAEVWELQWYVCPVLGQGISVSRNSSKDCAWYTHETVNTFIGAGIWECVEIVLELYLER